MKVRICLSDDKFIALLEWHTWFAWHPVLIDGELVWLESIERKLIRAPWIECFWNYRLKQKGGE